MDKSRIYRKVRVNGEVGYMQAYDVDGKPAYRGSVVAPSGDRRITTITGTDPQHLSRDVEVLGIYRIKFGHQGEIIEIEELVRPITPHKGGRTARLSGRISPEAKERLEILAKEHRCSEMDLITEWIDHEWNRREWIEKNREE